jgi:DNA ligase (NAD+)
MSLKKKVKYNTTLKKNKIDKHIQQFYLSKLKNNSRMVKLKTSVISFLTKLIKIKQAKTEFYKAKILEKAQSILVETPFTRVSELESIKGIGPSTLRKIKEFVKNGTTHEIQDYETNPLYQFLKIHGVGIRTAQELVGKNIKSVQELKEMVAKDPTILNDVQRKGLNYYDDINLRIPRSEIDTYKQVLDECFDKIKNPNSTYEIVGSYRRNAISSGDIDIIISDPNDSHIFQKFLAKLAEKQILIEILSRGNVKCLAISKLPDHPARRIDFMFSPSEEYAFAILYFTGSRMFNTLMRNQALKLGYSLNEHGLYKMVDGKKTHKISNSFPTEQSIFKFLKMEYKEPQHRRDYSSVVIRKNKTLKKRKSITTFKYIQKFKNQGIDILQMCSEKIIENMIRITDQYYYKNNKPILTDEQYDILKSYALERYPDNLTVRNGHLNVEISKDKVDLPYFMGSMEKIKPDTTALTNWKLNYKGPYVISSKLDGISALYSTENGTKKLYTRGNGSKGLDISYLIPYLQLPSIEDITIRGELLLTKELFENKYKGIYKNVRNMIGGVMTTKKVEIDKWQDIDFVGYEVINPVLKPSKQMEWLQDNNVITVTNYISRSISNEGLSKLLLETRDSDPYDIDGIIVVNDKIYERTTRKCPKHAFAFKMVLSDQVMESHVVNIHWQISKNGYIIPKIEVVPVEICGATITYASGHNAAFIEKNNIGVGAVVQMIRSGDVIPKIQAVVKPADKPLMPTVPYVWNDTHVDIILKDVETNKTVIMKKILSFIQTLDVPSFGEGNLKKVFNAGYDTISKILTMTPEDFMTIPGFKTKLSNKICNGIKNKLENISLPDLIVATNIFGRGFGKSRAKNILKHYPNILTSDESEEDKMEMVEELDGFAHKTAELFVPYIPKFIEFIHKTNLQHKLVVQTKKVNTSHPLYQKIIVMTGFRDKQLEKEIIDAGGEIKNSVSKKTFVLLVDSLDSDSGKADKARKFNVPLMTPYAFTNTYF